MKHRYSEEQLREAISQSFSIRQALQILGMAAKGGNYRVIHKAVVRYNIDTSHFTGRAHNKGKKLGSKRKIADYLNNQIPINSFRLKNRLLSENLLQPICSRCENTTWLDAPIPLELDHIDGDSQNNHATNLRLLCPNCHALTATYRGKNKKRVLS
jgi:hypothetical protein